MQCKLQKQDSPLFHLIEIREVNTAVPGNVQSQAHLCGAAMGGEGELKQSPQTSKMLGDAVSSVLLTSTAI